LITNQIKHTAFVRNTMRQNIGPAVYEVRVASTYDGVRTCVEE